MKVLLLLFILVNKYVLPHDVSDLYKLPKLFKMENYTNCMNEDNLYCELEFDVKSVGNDSNLWKIIQYSDSKESYFNWKILHRAMCFPKLYKHNEAKLKEIGLAKMKTELKLYNLDVDLRHIECKTTFTYTLYDYILLGCFVSYFCWIAVATYMDYFGKKLTNKYVEYFSIIYNYKKLTKENKNKHYVRLKFMQGIRFYTMLFVVSAHSVVSFSVLYTENPEFIEKLYSHRIITFLLYICSMTVQIFFVLSGWLSVLKIEEDSDNFSSLSGKNIVILIYNRLVRFLPMVWIYLCLFSSNVFFAIDIPLTKQLKMYFKTCTCNGWFYVWVLNWLRIPGFCNFHLWTISLDLQAFIILLAAFYVIIKFKKSIVKSLITLSILFIIIQINIIYFNDLKMHFKIISRNIFPFTRKYPSFTLNYVSTVLNVPSYLIGSMFGIFYLRKTKIVLQRFWLLTSISLIILTYSLIDIPMSRLTRSFFGGFLKSLFATGFGVFLFGVVQNPSTKFRRIFENRFVEILGACTLSIHVYHMPLVLTRGRSPFPLKIDYHEMVLGILGDLIKSVSIGFVYYLTIEQPFAMLTRWDYKVKGKIDNKVKNN